MFFPDGLDPAQAQLIVSDDAVEVDASLFLLDDSNAVVEDLTADLAGGQVKRGCNDTIHGTCSLKISRELDWGRARVQPFMTLTSRRFGSLSAPLGVFLLGVPKAVAGESPRTYDVTGFDLCLLLDQKIGSTYSVAAGAGYLASAQSAASSAGVLSVLVDSYASSATLPAARVWPLLDSKWSGPINDLLAAVNYRGAWFDAEGRLHFDRYIDLASRAPEWAYTADDVAVTTLAGRTLSRDFTDTPNRWVFILNDPNVTTGSGATTAPITYQVDNVSDGPTSQAARGRVIPDVRQLDAPDLASLQAQGNRIAAEARQVARYLEVTASPNPLHGHFDVATITDSELGVAGRWVLTDWTLPLDGSDMSQKWRAIDG